MAEPDSNQQLPTTRGCCLGGRASCPDFSLFVEVAFSNELENDSKQLVSDLFLALFNWNEGYDLEPHWNCLLGYGTWMLEQMSSKVQIQVQTFSPSPSPWQGQDGTLEKCSTAKLHPFTTFLMDKALAMYEDQEEFGYPEPR